GASPLLESERQSSEERSHRGHHDGAETERSGLVNGFFGRKLLLALGVEGEIDHHDGVLLDDTDEQNDADESDQGKIVADNDQSEQGAHAGGGQRRKNSDGMDVTFVENAKNRS